MPKKAKKAKRVLGLPSRVYIGFDSTGSEIVATYGSRSEVAEFRQPDEIVTGPWMRVPRAERLEIPRTHAAGCCRPKKHKGKCGPKWLKGDGQPKDR